MDTFAFALDRLACSAGRGVTPADTDAMLSCALWLLNDGSAVPRSKNARAPIEEILLAARRGGHRFVVAMLEDAPAHKAIPPLGRLLDVGGPSRIRRSWVMVSQPHDDLFFRTQAGREHCEELWREVVPPTAHPSVAAAMRRFFQLDEPLLSPAEEEEREEARARAEPVREHVQLSPRELTAQMERLARRSDLDALRLLLRQRDVSIRVVKMVATRRPTTPAIVALLVEHLGWISLQSIRVAVVENPFTPTRAALLLLPTCRARFRTIARADVHPRVQELARMFESIPRRA